MIQVKDIPVVRGMYSVGQVIDCNKNVGGERTQQVKARIKGKFPHFALLEDAENVPHKQRWCIKWVDFIIQEIK